MTDYLFFIITLLAALGCGLMAGVFFIFSNTVMSALDKLQPPEGIAAMQSINKVILNPLFFLVFIGTAVLCVFLALSLFWNWGHPGYVYMLIGILFYLIGSFLVTVVFNVPMNETLDAVRPDSLETANLWTRYLSDWTAWNHVRAVACLLGAGSFILALR